METMTQCSRNGAPARVRILSANLWNGRADAQAFAALVARLQVDIAAVQELAPWQAEALAAVLPHGRLEPAEDFHGMGIASRTPISVRRLKLPYRDARVADLTLGGAHGAPAPLELVNIHVQAPHSLQAWSTVRHRRGQWRGLQRHLNANPHRPRVVVGDFNATPLWPFYRRMSMHLRDAALLAPTRNGRRAQRTWGPRPGGPRLLRIDHAFVHRVEVLDFSVVEVVGGDHCAVVVDIALP